MAGQDTAPQGDTAAGSSPAPATGAHWPTASEIAAWGDTPDGAEGQEASETDESQVVDEGTVEAPVVEEAPQSKRAPIPYDRFEAAIRQKQEIAQNLAQAQAKNEMLAQQLQQVIEFVQRGGLQQAQQAPQPPQEDEFVDPEAAALAEIRKEMAEIKAWRQEQAVAATTTAMESEYNQAVSLYPLAAKAAPLVFALLENNKQLSVSDAVKEVHNHLAGVIPQAAPKAPEPTRPTQAARPPPPRGPAPGSSIAAPPRYKSLDDAMKAFLAQS